jgi:hypothetical protein
MYHELFREACFWLFLCSVDEDLAAIVAKRSGRIHRPQFQSLDSQFASRFGSRLSDASTFADWSHWCCRVCADIRLTTYC